MTMTDRESAQQLMAVYARALDEKDYETIEQCFAHDASVQYTGFSAAMNGREEITAHMKKALDPLSATQHMFTNFIIEVDGDAAKLYCDIIAQHVTGAGDDSEIYMAGGKYNVELRRRGEGWEFARLLANSVWGFGNREMLPRSG